MRTSAEESAWNLAMTIFSSRIPERTAADVGSINWPLLISLYPRPQTFQSPLINLDIFELFFFWNPYDSVSCPVRFVFSDISALTRLRNGLGDKSKASLWKFWVGFPDPCSYLWKEGAVILALEHKADFPSLLILNIYFLASRWHQDGCWTMSLFDWHLIDLLEASQHREFTLSNNVFIFILKHTGNGFFMVKMVWHSQNIFNFHFN